MAVLPGPPVDVRAALPRPRGPLSEFLVSHLARPVHPVPPCPPPEDDVVAGDDFQLALYICYELHYRSFAGVDEGWEWEPSLLGMRRTLESMFESAVLSAGSGGARPSAPGDVEAELHRIIAEGGGPSLSGHMAERGTSSEMQEFAIHRSAYQLKEADPHTWAIPRLSGGPKAAMIEIQADEYGGGVEADMHATLFAATMVALGLDPTYGAYLDRLPGITLATVNLVSLLGLHRRHRGALVGHLALFEMTSVVPMARYSRAMARLGVDPEGRRFYDVHVAVDAHHSLVAARRMAAGLAAAEPALAGDILAGARALMTVEGRFARHLLDSWAAGRSSLLDAVPCPTG